MMETEANSEETTQVSPSDLNHTDASRLQYVGDEHFEYEAIKLIFLNHFREFFNTPNESELRDHAPTPNTSAGVTKYIHEINKAYDLIKNGGLLNEFQCRALQQYEVMERDGEHVLVVKRTSPDEPARRILGAEQCFEALVKMHRAARCAGVDMPPLLARHYVVPLPCLTYFLTLCDISARSRSHRPLRGLDVPKHFNHTVQLDILLLTKLTEEFHYVLHYHDMYTDFVLLRPIVTIEETALSVEFFKIFADFGLPLFIRTSDEHIDLMKKVLSLLMKTWPTNKVSVHIAMKTIDRKVVEILSEWMDSTGCTNWGIACHVLQKKLNNIKSKDRSPHDLVFGARPPAEPAPAPTSPAAGTSTNEQHNPDTFTSSEESDSNSDPIVLIPPSTSTSSDTNDIEHGTVPITSEDISDTRRRQNNVRGSEWHTKTYDTCGECNTRIIIPYTCHRCRRPIHLFCSKKNITLNKYKYTATVVITCRSCHVSS